MASYNFHNGYTCEKCVHWPGYRVHLSIAEARRRQQCRRRRARARVCVWSCDRGQMECYGNWIFSDLCSSFASQVLCVAFCVVSCRVCASIIIAIIIERDAFPADCKCHRRNKCNLWRHWLTHLWAHLNASNPFKIENAVEFLPHFLHFVHFYLSKKTTKKQTNISPVPVFCVRDPHYTPCHYFTFFSHCDSHRFRLKYVSI